MKCVNLIGAKGGQGTSTLACAVALHAAGQGKRVALAGRRVDDLAAILGLPRGGTEYSGVTLVDPTADGDMSWVDLYVTDDLPVEDGANVVVLRGPDYLGLRRLTHQPVTPLAGVVLLQESGRSLHAGDVEATLGVPVLAVLTMNVRTARANDAGVFPTRMEYYTAAATAVLAVAL